MKFLSKGKMKITAEQFLDTTDSIYNICRMFPENNIKVNYNNHEQPVMTICIEGKNFNLRPTDWIIQFPINWISKISRTTVVHNDTFVKLFEEDIDENKV